MVTVLPLKVTWVLSATSIVKLSPLPLLMTTEPVPASTALLNVNKMLLSTATAVASSAGVALESEGAITTVSTSVADAPLLSLTVSVMPRCASEERVALLLLKIMARPTLSTKALVACSLKVNVHAALLLTDIALAVPIWSEPAISLQPSASSQMLLLPESVAARLRLSTASAFEVICTTREPPFQLASPSGSLIKI